MCVHHATVGKSNRVCKVVAGDVHCWFAWFLENQEIPPTNKRRQINITNKNFFFNNESINDVQNVTIMSALNFFFFFLQFVPECVSYLYMTASALISTSPTHC